MITNEENYAFKKICLDGLKPGDTIEYPSNIAWEDHGKIARKALEEN